MANNIAILDGASASQTTKTTDTAGVHVPHVNVDVIAAGDNNIGNVDVASIAAGDNNIGNVDIVTINSVAPAFGEGVLGATVQRVTIATDDDGVAHLATIAGDTTAIQTSVELIDDTVVAVDAVGTSAKVVMVGAIRDDALSTLTPAEGDAVPLRTNSTGALHVQVASGAADVVDDATFTPGTTGVVMVGFQADEASTDSVDEGDGGAARMTLDRKQIVTEQPHTAGGLSYATIVSAATNNETDIKTAAGKVYFLSVQSIDATPVYIKFFNATAANVTMGTTAAAYQFMCPAAATAANGAGIVLTFPTGIEHTTAITVAITTGIALTDNTSTSANEVVLTIGYK